MDGETFYDLVKRLTAVRLTRLDALRGLIASAAVGLTGATLATTETDAKKDAKKGGNRKANAAGKNRKKQGNGKQGNGAGKRQAQREERSRRQEEAPREARPQ